MKAVMKQMGFLDYVIVVLMVCVPVIPHNFMWMIETALSIVP